MFVIFRLFVVEGFSLGDNKNMKIKQFMGAILLACFFAVPTSQATVITATFEAEVTSGVFAGTVGQGSFTYDDSYLLFGDESLGPAGTFFGEEGLVDLQFSIFGQTFAISNDLEYPDFPLVGFFNFTPDYMEFLIDELTIPILEPSVLAIEISDWLTPSVGGTVDFVTTVSVYVATAAVSEPAMWALLGIGLLVIGLGRKTDKV